MRLISNFAEFFINILGSNCISLVKGGKCNEH